MKQKYNIGDKVYILENNRVALAEIYAVALRELDPVVQNCELAFWYIIETDTPKASVFNEFDNWVIEHKLFPTKEDLIKSL